MAANSWNSSSFVFPFSSLFSSSFLGLAWELHVRSWERDECTGGKLDLVWTFMVCIDGPAWFLKVLWCFSRPSLWWFSDLFVVICLAVFCGRFLGDFVGCHIWGPCASLASDFAPNISWIRLYLVVFRVARVVSLESQHLRFLLIESDSGRFLWGRCCPRGTPAIPEVSLQSVEWFGRSGDGKLRFDPRVGFLEGVV
jgi:hypothetical protein